MAKDRDVQDQIDEVREQSRASRDRLDKAVEEQVEGDTVRDRNTTARRAAEDARDAAEVARDTAETARGLAEVARSSAEEALRDEIATGNGHAQKNQT